jgi:hypothetical protein
MLGLNFGLVGKFKLTVKNSDGTIKEETDWIPNLIVNGGLDFVATKTLDNTRARVGTGNTPPAITDTSLTAPAGSLSDSTTVISTTGYPSASPPYGEVLYKYTFNIGHATGVLAEVGVISAYDNTTLLTHALIKDASGNPTTITVLSTESLVLTYSFRNYYTLTDSTGTLTLAAIPYNYTIRAIEFSSTNWFTFNSVTIIRDNFYTANSYSSGSLPATAGGNITGTSTQTSSAITANTYTNGTYSQIGNINFGSGAGSAFNLIRLPLGWGVFGILFAANIPKNTTNTLSIQFQVTWNRYP